MKAFSSLSRLSAVGSKFVSSSPYRSCNSFAKSLSRINLKYYLTDNQKQYSTLVRQKASDFTATAVLPDGRIGQINLHSLLDKNKYICLLFYPLDFTFVCPTEIIEFNNSIKEFESKKVQLLGISVDSEFTHLAWINTPKEKGGIGKINFPLVSDLDKSICKKYNTLIDEKISLRGLFLIDKEFVIRHMVVNDLPIGRNVEDILRVIDAMEIVEKEEVCPANWKKGDKGMKPTLQDVANHISKK